MQISVKADIRQAMRELSIFQREAIPKAAARALNSTARQVESAAVKEIAERTGIKQKDVRVSMTLVKAGWTKLQSMVKATGRTLNVIRFGAKQVKQGVSYNAWGKRRTHKGAFIGNKGRTVFMREGKGRTPIRPVYGPNIPRAMASDVVQQKMEQVIKNKWPTNFAREIKYYLSKL